MSRARCEQTFIDESTGTVVPSGTASIFIRNSDGSNGSSATLYTDPLSASTASNPTALVSGKLDIWLDEGSYNVLVQGDSFNNYTISFESINAIADLARGSVGALLAANNLLDLSNKPLARTNLGLGSAATSNTSDFDASGAAGAEQIRATAAEALALKKASNLSDVANAATARTSLGLGTAATHASTDFDVSGAASTEQSRALAAEALLAPKSSPTFTGTPLLTTTPNANDNSKKVADTEYVDRAITQGVVTSTQQAGTGSSAYTFQLVDLNTVVEGTNATAATWTIPTHASVAFPVNTLIEIFQYGAGQITIAGAGGVTLRSDGGKVKTAGQYASIYLRQRTADEWVLAGDLGA